MRSLRILSKLPVGKGFILSGGAIFISAPAWDVVGIVPYNRNWTFAFNLVGVDAHIDPVVQGAFPHRLASNTKHLTARTVEDIRRAPQQETGGPSVH